MELIQLELPQYRLSKLRYDFYNSRNQLEPLWYMNLWFMKVDVIGWSLKMIEVYIETNRKEMDDGVKKGEKCWKIAIIQ